RKLQTHAGPVLEQRTLEMMGDLYYQMGAMSDSAKAYQEKFERASERSEEIAFQIKSLGRLALPLALIDVDRGIAATEHAARLSSKSDDAFSRALGTMVSSAYRLVYNRWNHEDWRGWQAANSEARRLNHDEIPVYLQILSSLLLFL